MGLSPTTSRRKTRAKEKLPTWFNTKDILYILPKFRTNLPERTAKMQPDFFFSFGNFLIDLTGGFGSRRLFCKVK
jgi:hypothetical protein